jgi:hypothetical protein
MYGNVWAWLLRAAIVGWLRDGWPGREAKAKAKAKDRGAHFGRKKSEHFGRNATLWQTTRQFPSGD